MKCLLSLFPLHMQVEWDRLRRRYRVVTRRQDNHAVVHQTAWFRSRIKAVDAHEQAILSRGIRGA